jgi:hypothetical protein
MRTLILTYFAFFGYQKLIYYKNKPIHEHLVSAHLMFTATGLFWVPGNINYWLVIPLLVNCTRIEMYYESLAYHWNNIGYFIVHVVKNLPIWLMFHIAHWEGYSGAYLISILIMDTMAWVLWQIKVITAYHNKLSTTNYLTLTTLT